MLAKDHSDLFKLVTYKGITDYFSSFVETRIDYVSVFTQSGLIIPILYYCHEQIGTMGFNDCDVSKSVIEDLDQDVINEKIEEITNHGEEIIHISYMDNLHTHPIGIRSFSGYDFRGDGTPFSSVLQSDIFLSHIGEHIGSNMLYGKDGELYRTIVRELAGEEYTYQHVDSTELSWFEPHMDSATLDKLKELKEKEHEYECIKDNLYKRTYRIFEEIFRKQGNIRERN